MTVDELDEWKTQRHSVPKGDFGMLWGNHIQVYESPKDTCNMVNYSLLQEGKNCKMDNMNHPQEDKNYEHQRDVANHHKGFEPGREVWGQNYRKDGSDHYKAFGPRGGDMMQHYAQTAADHHKAFGRKERGERIKSHTAVKRDIGD